MTQEEAGAQCSDIFHTPLAQCITENLELSSSSNVKTLSRKKKKSVFSPFFPPQLPFRTFTTVQFAERCFSFFPSPPSLPLLPLLIGLSQFTPLTFSFFFFALYAPCMSEFHTPLSLSPPLFFFMSVFISNCQLSAALGQSSRQTEIRQSVDPTITIRLGFIQPTNPAHLRCIQPSLHPSPLASLPNVEKETAGKI